MDLINEKIQISHTVYYSVQVPEQKGPRPLLIVLHGFGQVARQFITVFEPLAKKGILVAAPQGAHQFYTHLKKGQVGFSWLTRYERDQSVVDFVGYMEQFYKLLQERFEVDSQRVFMLGFSQGVSMAYRTWAHSSLPVRGVVACGGDLPPDIVEQLDGLPPIQILLVHGSRDEDVSPEKVEEAREHLAASGLQPELFVFEGGHVVPSVVLPKVERMVKGTGSDS
jgi:phospholipase/carboxylesterase